MNIEQSVKRVHSKMKKKMCRSWSWPRGYETFIMLNATEHEISTAHKN